ncbi:MAG: ATP-grasp domain-containing protein [Pseudobacteriovorax sp.]|nr:ATP-grasp domain-containing protein [Pseudobacteriovorax sp.]
MQRLGILGAGQLAMLLAVEAKILNLHVSILANHDHDPAVSVADDVCILPSQDQEAGKAMLQRFLSTVDIVIFESELFAGSNLMPDDSNLLKHMCPPLPVMKLCSDKVEQKSLFTRLDLPTPKWQSFDATSEPHAVVKNLWEAFPEGFVLKWAKGGYDGKGVMIMTPNFFADESAAQRLKEFIRQAFDFGVRVYGEELADFSSECALVATRSQDGELLTFPLVDTQQEKGTCRLVVGQMNEPQLEEDAARIAKVLSDDLGYVGTFALEFFVVNSQLFINEMAPRVHNSGHCTLDSSSTNQFRSHLLAVLGKPLEQHNSKKFFAMINVLGPDTVLDNVPKPSFHGPAQLYWYNKMSSKPMRKLGHLNIIAKSKSEADEMIQTYSKAINDWEASF